MSSKIFLFTGLIGCCATIALVQPHIAIAKTSVEIGETAKALTFTHTSHYPTIISIVMVPFM